MVFNSSSPIVSVANKTFHKAHTMLTRRRDSELSVPLKIFVHFPSSAPPPPLLRLTQTHLWRAHLSLTTEQSRRNSTGSVPQKLDFNLHMGNNAHV